MLLDAVLCIKYAMAISRFSRHVLINKLHTTGLQRSRTRRFATLKHIIVLVLTREFDSYALLDDTPHPNGTTRLREMDTIKSRHVEEGVNLLRLIVSL